MESPLDSGPTTWLPATVSMDAETLDGKDSSEFASAGHDHDNDYVKKEGDTMTGSLNLPVDGLVAGLDQLVLSGSKVGTYRNKNRNGPGQPRQRGCRTRDTYFWQTYGQPYPRNRFRRSWARGRQGVSQQGRRVHVDRKPYP